jgi:SAM-dependent methyltransferase
MQAEVWDWVNEMVELHHLWDKSTLEVGSYNVNGSIDNCFRGSYWGVDIRPGPGVDQVCDGEDLPFVYDSFDVVVSTETLEHVLRPWKFVSEMVRVSRWGGHILITTVGYSFPEHDVPHDYWRFGHGALEALVEDSGATIISKQDRLPDHIYILATKAV